MTEKYLRILIAEVISEAMKSPSSLSADTAIWTNFYEGADLQGYTAELDFVMYNVQGAQSSIEQQIQDMGGELEGMEDETFDIIRTAIDDNILAVMRVRTTDESEQCNGAWEVIRAASEKGFGPTLYDMVMSIAPNGLTSDRSSVSRDAQSVWNFYAQRRDDVDKAYLDDIDIEVTPLPDDDCRLHGGRGADMIRNAKSKMFFEWLISEYEEVQNLLAHGMKEKGENDWGNSFTPEELVDYVDNFYNYYEDELEDIDSFLPELDLDEFRDSWSEMEYGEGMNLYDSYPPSSEQLDPLNLSYNTDYADDDFYDMTSNHATFIGWCEDEMGMYVEAFTDMADEDINFIVRDFFQKKA
jgi:hypothetical protein